MSFCQIDAIALPRPLEMLAIALTTPRQPSGSGATDSTARSNQLRSDYLHDARSAPPVALPRSSVSESLVRPVPVHPEPNLAATSRRGD